jgi:hypothetical protein
MAKLNSSSASLAIVAFCATAWVIYQQQKLQRRSTSPRLTLPDRDNFVGAWILKSYRVEDMATGARTYPLGQDADGLIVSVALNLRCHYHCSLVASHTNFSQFSLNTYALFFCSCTSCTHLMDT